MRAVANGTFFARPRGENGYQPRHKTHRKYQKPVFGRLQSKNEDVEEEIKVIRMHPEHKHSLILFIGHDGLGDMRVMHLFGGETPPGHQKEHAWHQNSGGG